MSAISTTALILRTLAIAVTMPTFGKKANRLAPLLNTVSDLAELPAELEPARQSLLAQVQSWVDEKRGPTDDELATFRELRNDLDAQARAARAALDQPAASPPPKETP